MGGTDRARPGGNGSSGRVRGRQRGGLRTKNARRPDFQRLNCEKDPGPSGLRTALSPGNYGPQGEPSSCCLRPPCLPPTSTRKMRIFLPLQLGTHRTTRENIRAFSHLAAPQSPCPAPESPGARPVHTLTLTKALETLVSERSRPAGPGHLQSPPKPRIPFPLNCPHPHPTPGRAHRVPSPANPGSRFPAASSPSDLLLPALPSHLTCFTHICTFLSLPSRESLIFRNQFFSFI